MEVLLWLCTKLLYHTESTGCSWKREIEREIIKTFGLTCQLNPLGARRTSIKSVCTDSYYSYITDGLKKDVTGLVTIVDQM